MYNSEAKSKHNIKISVFYSQSVETTENDESNSDFTLNKLNGGIVVARK